jgi:hypothetical protein
VARNAQYQRSDVPAAKFGEPMEVELPEGIFVPGAGFLAR